MKLNFTPSNSFQVLDEILAQQVVKPLSLNPNQSVITSFTELEVKIIQQVSDTKMIIINLDKFEKILNDLLHNFTENILWPRLLTKQTSAGRFAFFPH